MARSRISSSELGASSHSVRLAVGNSRPMMGVTSNDSYESRAPESLRGSRESPLVTTGASTSIAEGAMAMGKPDTKVRGLVVLEGKGCDWGLAFY